MLRITKTIVVVYHAVLETAARNHEMLIVYVQI
jgi:hypothetical protein